VEECPISSPLINRGIAVLWQNGCAGKVPNGVGAVEFFANADDTQMLVQVSCSPSGRRAALRAWAEELQASMPQISGVVVFREPADKEQQRLEKLLTIGSNRIEYETRRATYRVTAGSFFQVNRYLSDELVSVVTAGQSGDTVLDLYAGVGLFSTVLAGDFHHTFCVESSQTSAADLSYNLSSNGEAVQATTEQYLARLEAEGRVGKGEVLPQRTHKPDLAVVDPPRSGLGERVARKLANLGVPRVIYVSCDPATLARDLVILLEAGYGMEQVHLVDLFPQTYHLESIVHLVRQGVSSLQ